MNDPSQIPALSEVLELLRSSPESTNLILPCNFADAADWSGFQLGYRVHGNSGESLVSEQPGAWHPQWWIVASNYFNDPFFVDLREADLGFPVRYAAHGAGRWDPVLVAPSIESFAACIRRLVESDPLDAAAWIEAEMPSNEFWNEVVATYREVEE